METYIVQEDKKRLCLFTGLYLAATIALLIVAIFSFAIYFYIGAFIAVTVVWFTIKAMGRYASKLLKKTPVCKFDKKGITMYCLTQKEKQMKYKDVKEVKVIRDKKSVKLFFAGKGVTHPSGYDYVGIIYPFKKQCLIEVEHTIKKYLKSNDVFVVDVQ